MSILFLALLAFLVGWFVWAGFGATSVAFESSEGNWHDHEVPLKGRDYSVIQASFEQFKISCGNRTATLYRTTEPNYINVFEWWNYATDPKWKVPYRPSQVLSSAAPSCVTP